MDDRTEQAVRHTAKEANHLARDYIERTERAAQANVNVIANQAETLRGMWQAGVDVAASATARSADRVADTFGVAGDDAAEKVASQAAGNLGALTQAASVLADSVRASSSEWVDLGRHSTERSMDHVVAMTRCWSPSDFVHTLADTFRDNMEMLMESNRRIAEINLRTAEEASHVVAEISSRSNLPGEAAQTLASDSE
jgi:hypothetical protein